MKHRAKKTKFESFSQRFLIISMVIFAFGITYVRSLESSYNKVLQKTVSEIKEIQDEIDYLIENILNDSYNVSLRLKDIANPFSIFLLSLYNNNDLLYHILSDTSDEKYMYIYNEILFVTPKDVYIELYYYDDLYGEKKQHPSHNRNNLGSSYFAQSKKPYGNSWFSPEAHHNIKILKKQWKYLIIYSMKNTQSKKY